MKTSLLLVVADNSSARLYAVAPGAAPALVVELDHPEGRSHSGELVSDRPGQMRNENASRPQSVAQRETPAAIERQRFGGASRRPSRRRSERSEPTASPSSRW